MLLTANFHSKKRQAMLCGALRDIRIELRIVRIVCTDILLASVYRPKVLRSCTVCRTCFKKSVQMKAVFIFRKASWSMHVWVMAAMRNGTHLHVRGRKISTCTNGATCPMQFALQQDICICPCYILVESMCLELFGHKVE